MKNLLLFILLLLFTQLSLAQTKIDEYEKTDSDSESGRIDAFLVNLLNEKESKGLIVIYSGENEEQIGNILRHIEGIKQYINFRGHSIDQKNLAEKVSFKINKGKQPLFKEFWIYPKNIALPEIKERKLNLDNLKTKFLYASICASCEPAVPILSSDSANLEFYAELLKQYPNYTGLIIIHPDAYIREKDSYNNALTYVIGYRNILTKEYKIDNKRISIKIAKPVGEGTPVIAKFFIVPKTVK